MYGIILRKHIPEQREVWGVNPGHEAHVYLRSTLRTLAEVFWGDIDVRSACQNQSLQVQGSAALTRILARRLPVSRFAENNPKRSKDAS